MHAKHIIACEAYTCISSQGPTTKSEESWPFVGYEVFRKQAWRSKGKDGPKEWTSNLFWPEGAAGEDRAKARWPDGWEAEIARLQCSEVDDLDEPLQASQRTKGSTIKIKNNICVKVQGDKCCVLDDGKQKAQVTAKAAGGDHDAAKSIAVKIAELYASGTTEKPELEAKKATLLAELITSDGSKASTCKRKEPAAPSAGGLEQTIQKKPHMPAADRRKERPSVRQKPGCVDSPLLDEPAERSPAVGTSSSESEWTPMEGPPADDDIGDVIYSGADAAVV